MARKLDYRWHLRQVMASRGMFSTTDLIPPLAARGIRLSSSQVYRLEDKRIPRAARGGIRSVVENIPRPAITCRRCHR